ncbi:tRNA wybutosine-synthesizing protein 4 [Blattella germanica]|nr:tRNA wybutosine-synthesizing protein 4 [Blattella germanica]
MIKNGYFMDKYVPCFVSKYSRRTPLIHLGYYMRMLTVDYALRSFLNSVSSSSVQIISCGAGFDTSFFRFADAGFLSPDVCVYEVDFKEVVERKIQCILNSESLQNCIGPFKVNSEGLIGSQYKLLGSDLQDLNKLESNLLSVGVRFQIPTLILSEVAICYMDEDSASKLIEWAAVKFMNSTFVTYEQVYPNDGFGVVMEKHFENMKSPLLSLSKYPSLEQQEERYTSKGWSTCRAGTAYEMFLKITSPEERRRIALLEPFDEFEEWHLEGCHFALIVATKGSLVDWDIKHMNIAIDRGICEPSKKEIHWELNTAAVFRFMHQTVKLPSEDDGHILVIGGFGPSSDSLHGRRHEVLRISLRDNDALFNEINVEEVKMESDVRLDCLHHTCTRLSLRGPDGSTRILLYGGRHSPCKPLNIRPLILSVRTVGEDMTMHVETTELGENMPLSRWRHSAVCVNFGTHDNVLVFGGRTTDMKILHNLLIWMVKSEDASLSWTEVKDASTSWPSARFSHSATVWQKRTMVVSGGLDKDILPLRDIWYYNTDSTTWQELPVCGILPRYSHTSAVSGDKLILIGGVNTLPGRQPGICVVDLNENSCVEFRLPAQDPEHPIMLHNHTSEVVDDLTVIVIGGGGNCFSFGTMFNGHVMKIDLDQFR